MRFRALVVAGILVASVAVMSGQAPVAGPLFHFTEPMGPYGVGLKVVDQYDFSRT